MLKAADAYSEAGYDVRVVSTRHLDWAWETDQQVYPRRSWRWKVVNYDRRSCPSVYWRSGLRNKAANLVAKTLGPRCPLGISARAYARVHSELVKAAIAEPCDFYFGGTTGALAAVAEAARLAKVPFGLDLEDFHSAEQDESPHAHWAHHLAESVESAILPRAAFLTAGSAAIAAEYAKKYAVKPITIHNVFPLPNEAPKDFGRRGERLRMYWFSQTIGPNRGLEDAIQAVRAAGVSAELHVRGRTIPSYWNSLVELARKSEHLRLVYLQPAEPDAMVELCRGYDIGLALEQGHILNRSLCLTNKPFTYMQAGLAIAMTDTEGQRALADDLKSGVIRFRPGDVRTLAHGLSRWARNDDSLIEAKRATWAAARRRWHWEHALERGALLAATERVFEKTTERSRAA